MINVHQEELITKLVGVYKGSCVGAVGDQRLRIGIIVDSNIVSSDIYDFVDWTTSRKSIELALIINQDLKSDKFYSKFLKTFRKYRIKSFLSRFFSFTLRKLEFLIFKYINKYIIRDSVIESYFTTKNLSQFNIKQLQLSPIISSSGFVHRFRHNQINKVKEENLDILIRFGTGILKGEILNCTPFGVISFHHGDHEINRGGPAGFWEIVNHQSKTCFIIQQLTEELDGGNVLFRGAFSTKPFFIQNQAYLYKKSYFYLKTLVIKLSVDRSLKIILDQKPYSFPLYKNPTFLEYISYLKYISTFIFIKLYFRLISRPWLWQIAYLKNNWKNSVLWKGNIVSAPKNHYFADPFLLTHKENTYCFVEDYDMILKKGKISVGLIYENEWRYLGCALEEEFHLSFPYVFEINGSIYMIPETSKDRSIRLYECQDFPLKWKIKSILMTNVEASDTVVFQKDNLWWLLTSIDPVCSGDCSSELFLFYSDNLFSNDWHSHPHNPVIINPDTGRNGGILRDEFGNIYRVAQKYGFNMYGESFSIYKITELTTDNYEEVLVGPVTANYFRSISGTHHMHSNGDYTVYDFVARQPLK